MKAHITLTDDAGNTYDGVADLTRVAKNRLTAKKVQKAKFTKAVAGPAGAIRKLYEVHFFKTEKSISHVMKKLSDDGINFSIQLISMALYRAKYLTKRDSPGSYTYIQKQSPM
jgi:hypothetical protein